LTLVILQHRHLPAYRLTVGLYRTDLYAATNTIVGPAAPAADYGVSPTPFLSRWQGRAFNGPLLAGWPYNGLSSRCWPVAVMNQRNLSLASTLLAAAILSVAQLPPAAVGQTLPPNPLPPNLRPAPNRGLVIIAPRRFESALKPFVEYRRRNAPVETAFLETVLKENPGADDPEKLKRFLYAAWQRRKARYVLLVGDATVLPVRYMVLDRVAAAAFDTAFYPSDLYYADVARNDGSFEDWNGRKDGFHAQYFGEIHGEKTSATRSISTAYTTFPAWPSDAGRLALPTR
jgi:hypothetical protein